MRVSRRERREVMHKRERARERAREGERGRERRGRLIPIAAHLSPNQFARIVVADVSPPIVPGDRTVSIID